MGVESVSTDGVLQRRIAEDANRESTVVELPSLRRRERRTSIRADTGRLKCALSAEPRSVFAARQAVSQYVMGEGVDLEGVRTAVSEAVGNAVCHAYRGRAPGPVELQAEWTNEGLVVQVSDKGEGMTPHIGGAGLGLGLALIGKASDRFEIVEGTGVTIRMFFKRHG